MLISDEVFAGDGGVFVHLDLVDGDGVFLQGPACLAFGSQESSVFREEINDWQASLDLIHAQGGLWDTFKDAQKLRFGQ